LDQETKNGITLKMTEIGPEKYKGLCLNPKDIPPDDLDDEILAQMIYEAGIFYEMEKNRR